MIQGNLGEQIKTTVIKTFQSAAQSEIDSTTIDTAGYDGFLVEVIFGTITSGSDVDVHLETGTTTSPTDNVEGSNVAVADTRSNDVVKIDVKGPFLHRYFRVVVTRTTQNAEVNSIILHQYNPRLEPVTDDSASVVDCLCLVSPAEGTP